MSAPAPAARCLAIPNGPPVYADVAALRAASNFGEFGGRYIPETLVAAHEELERVYVECTQDPAFHAELDRLGRDYIGRPTPLYFAQRLTQQVGGAQIWLKREELAFTGSHKINNALGQALVAKRIGKPRVIAETGAGQHGVATATACALLSACAGPAQRRLFYRPSFSLFLSALFFTLCRPRVRRVHGRRRHRAAVAECVSHEDVRAPGQRAARLAARPRPCLTPAPPPTSFLCP